MTISNASAILRAKAAYSNVCRRASKTPVDTKGELVRWRGSKFVMLTDADADADGELVERLPDGR